MIDFREYQDISRKAQTRAKWKRYNGLLGATEWNNRDFRCNQCYGEVSTAAWAAGVHNRNHCPYCLWSRHMDLWEAGDRLSACKAGMRPVGLALKQARKKYHPEGQGELMVVHACTGCGKLSINRLAADDAAGTILEIFEASLLPGADVRARAEREGIRMLAECDRWIVQERLQGCICER